MSRIYEKGRANIVRLAAIDETLNALSVTVECQIVNSLLKERKQLEGAGEGDYIHIGGGMSYVPATTSKYR